MVVTIQNISWGGGLKLKEIYSYNRDHNTLYYYNRGTGITKLDKAPIPTNKKVLGSTPTFITRVPTMTAELEA